MARSQQLQELWALLDEQEYQRVLEQTQDLLATLQGPLLREAYKLMGLACFRQRKYREASVWFREACQGSDDSGDWFNLAVSATMQGEIEQGAQAFEQVRLCQEAARYRQEPGFYTQLYWYVSALCDRGEYERLQPLLNELTSVYPRLHCTETTFLYIRRLPFLSTLLSLVTRCFREQEKREEGIAWLQEFGQSLDEQGQRKVQEAIRELQGEVRS